MTPKRVIELTSEGDIYQQLAAKLHISREAARLILLGSLYGQHRPDIKLIVDGVEVK